MRRLNKLILYIFNFQMLLSNGFTSAYGQNIVPDPVHKQGVLREEVFTIESRNLFAQGAHEESLNGIFVGEIKIVESVTKNRGICEWYVAISIYNDTRNQNLIANTASSDLPVELLTFPPNIVGKYDCGTLPREVIRGYYSARRSIKNALRSVAESKDYASENGGPINNKDKSFSQNNEMFVTAKFLGGKVDDNLTQLYMLLHEIGLLPVVEVLITESTLSRVLLRHGTIYDYLTSDLKKLIRELNIGNIDVDISEDEVKLKRLGGRLKIPFLDLQSMTYGRKVELKENETLAAHVRDNYLFRNYNPYENKRVKLSAAKYKVLQFARLNRHLDKTPTGRLPYVNEGEYLFPADGFEAKIDYGTFQKIKENNSTSPLFSSKNVVFLRDDLNWRTQAILTTGGKVVNNSMSSTLEGYCPSEPMQPHLLLRLKEMGLKGDLQRSILGNLKRKLAPVVVFDRFPALPEVGSNMRQIKMAIMRRLSRSAFGFSMPPDQMKEEVFQEAYSYYKKNKLDLDKAEKLFQSALTELKLKNFAYQGSLPLQEMDPEFKDNLGDLKLMPSFVGTVQEQHGLKIASLIGAKCNSYGISGVAEGSLLYAYDLSKKKYGDTLKDVVVNGNVCHPFCIFNASIAINECVDGATDSRSCMTKNESTSIQNLLQENYENLLILVAAAGKGRESNGVYLGEEICSGAYSPLPACFDRVDNKVTVTSGYLDDTSGQVIRLLDPRVNYSSTSVDLIAPGKGGFGLELGKHQFEGTSPATALVSGALSMLHAIRDDLEPGELVHRIKYTADLNEVSSEKVKFGWINVARAATEMQHDLLRLKGEKDRCVDLEFVEFPSIWRSETPLYLFKSGKNEEQQQIPAELMDAPAVDPKGSKTRRFLRHLVRVSYNEKTSRYTVVLRRMFKGRYHLDVYRNVSFFPDGKKASYPTVKDVIHARECNTGEEIIADLDRVEELVVRARIKRSLY